MYGILIGTPAKGGHRGINMKKLLVNHKKYGFGDFLRIPFTVCPVYAGIKTLNQVLVSVLPSLQVLATAAFIDTALRRSVIRTGVAPTVDSEILTLSTCTGVGYATRWVIQAALRTEK